VRRIVSLVSWWALLVLLWTAYVGTTDEAEVVAGLLAAAVAAVALEVVRSQRLLRFTVDRKWLVRGFGTPAWIVYDFGVVTWELVRALARGRRVAGRYVEVSFPAGEKGRAVHAWRRAYATTLGTMDPNAIVVDIDPERNVAVLHALRPDLRTGREAL
jgi:multisubunit Na+/H+ antiporter MnhE subunit